MEKSAGSGRCVTIRSANPTNPLAARQSVERDDCRQVLADHSRYRNREVQLSGAVVDSYSLANQGAYRIDDGQLWVVSDKGTPRKDARVTVKGTIREGFNLGSLGDQITLPGIGVGLVLLESSHTAK